MITKLNLVESQRIYRDFELHIKCAIEIKGETGLPADFAAKAKSQIYDVEDAVKAIIVNIEHYVFREMYEKADTELRAAVNHGLRDFQKKVHFVPIANEYNGYKPDQFAYGNQPWYEIPTYLGLLKVGFRSKVHVFDWSKTVVKETAEELFSDFQVTKSERMIHAHSLMDLSVYIIRVMRKGTHGY